MHFSALEQKLFSTVLEAELGIPVNAVLSFEDEEFPLITIPQVSEDGYFELQCYGAPAYKPEPEEGRETPIDSEFFGTHLDLRRLWIEQCTVRLKIEDRPHPNAFQVGRSSPNLEVKVLLADHNHRGKLRIKNNQIVVRESKLKKVKLSLVGLPKMRYPVGESILAKQSYVGEWEKLQERLEDEVKVQLILHRRTTLKTGTGWRITLTEDNEDTRGYVSYSGQIARDGEEEFDVMELNHLLEGLSRFLSFAACAHRHPTAAIGYDSKNLATWGQIGQFLPMPSSTNWFSDGNAASTNVYLKCLFPRFWSAWEKHEDEVNRTIEYYIDSEAIRKAGFPQEAVAVSYAGLEMLADLLVSDQKKNPTHVIDRALEQYNVPDPCSDPLMTPVTTKLANDLGLCRSGVPLLNSVRNYVVHPLERDGHAIKTLHSELLDSTYSKYYYVHDLSQYFLEYLFLQGLCSCTPERHRYLTETLSL